MQIYDLQRLRRTKQSFVTRFVVAKAKATPLQIVDLHNKAKLCFRYAKVIAFAERKLGSFAT